MPIVYAIAGPIVAETSVETISGHEVSKKRLSPSIVKYYLFRKLKMLQNIIPPGLYSSNEAKVGEFQSITNIRQNQDQTLEFVAREKSTTFQKLTLPVFNTLAECETALKSLKASVAPALKKHNFTYLPILIEIQDLSELGVKASGCFEYMSAGIKEVNDEKNKKRVVKEFVQEVQIAPAIYRTCYLINAKKLDVDGDHDNTRPYQIVSFKLDNFFIPWNRPGYLENKDQPDAYEFYWKYASSAHYFVMGEEVPANEPVIEKIIRILQNYAHPFSQNIAVASLISKFGSIGRMAEKAVAGTWGRNHVALADSMVDELKKHPEKYLDNKSIIKFITTSIASAKTQHVEFNENGSLILRINYIIAQLTEGKLADYTKASDAKLAEIFSEEFVDAQDYSKRQTDFDGPVRYIQYNKP